ncbi:MAG: hybrid sensor histidine kinase/response regulator [Planctomycetes bacterium]|nr:hybrid sensor histidine kinase/response regulator [Planctomycetota bacterium]MBL7145500.1 hybrid sensor histidine kinase/response regulator [Phycisphaerae bacterium]
MQSRDKILAVDDDIVDIRIIEKLLGRNFEFRTASTGEQALEIATDFQPDIILLDNMLPGMDGGEVCQQIRADSRLRHTKIIMISGKTMASERIEAYEAGADDYITKPFDEDELLAKIRVYLRLKSVEEVDQFKTNVLTLLGHETRTPLTSLIGSAEMLMSEENIDAEEQKLFMVMVYNSAKRLHSLFEKVMLLSLLKSRKQQFNMEPAELCEVVREAICEVALKAAERNVKIEEQFDAGPTVHLDKNEIKNVVTMILDNAIRFSPSDGSVTVGISSNNEDVRLSVNDQGEGIDSDYLPYVFEELSDPDVAHHSEGHGLSLAIARQVVLQHNGTVSAESTKGSGTNFTVRLPIMVSSELANCEK